MTVVYKKNQESTEPAAKNILVRHCEKSQGDVNKILLSARAGVSAGPSDEVYLVNHTSDNTQWTVQ